MVNIGSAKINSLDHAILSAWLFVAFPFEFQIIENYFWSSLFLLISPPVRSPEFALEALPNFNLYLFDTGGFEGDCGLLVPKSVHSCKTESNLLGVGDSILFKRRKRL